MDSEKDRQDRWWRTFHVLFENSLRDDTRKPYDQNPAGFDHMVKVAEFAAKTHADRMHGAIDVPRPKDKLVQLVQATQALVRFCNNTGHPDGIKQGQLQQHLIVTELALEALGRQQERPPQDAERVELLLRAARKMRRYMNENVAYESIGDPIPLRDHVNLLDAAIKLFDEAGEAEPQ